MKTLRLYADGAARRNPGPAAVGVVIKDDQGNTVDELGCPIGIATNNVAEYRALIEGLKAAAKGKPDRLEIYLDSKLVVEQIKGSYKVKKPELKPLYDEAKKLLEGFAYGIEHVERENNSRADELANLALDGHPT
jgi:ribonuclease HI